MRNSLRLCHKSLFAIGWTGQPLPSNIRAHVFFFASGSRLASPGLCNPSNTGVGGLFNALDWKAWARVAVTQKPAESMALGPV